MNAIDQVLDPLCAEYCEISKQINKLSERKEKLK